jgi:hypothetical protein
VGLHIFSRIYLDIVGVSRLENSNIKVQRNKKLAEENNKITLLLLKLKVADKK